MKFFITGGKGLLGSTLLQIVKKSEVVGTYFAKEPEDRGSYVRMDITDRETVLNIIRRVRPGVIVHCAAMTDVDACEDERERAWSINVKGTTNICDGAREVGAKVVYISTDYVFDGENGPYSEDDEPNPINYYGKTKLEGERIVQQLNDHLIVRSTVVYGKNEGNKKSFVQWVIQNLTKNKEITVINGQYGNPTLAEDLSGIIVELLRRGQRGLLNVAGDMWLSRLETAHWVARVFGFDKKRIRPIDSKDFTQKARRPERGGFKLGKIKQLGIRPLTLEQGLEQLKSKRE